MKNFIIYFYNIIPITIKFGKNGYTFSDGNSNYYLKENIRTLEELSELYDLSAYAKKFGVDFHEIILNKNGDILSCINGKVYILMKILINEYRCVELKDLEKLFNLQIYRNYRYIVRNNWKELWSERVDYIELKLSEYKDVNKEVIPYIDYNIGLIENAIQLLLDVENHGNFINHIRIKKDMTILDFYDPLNLVIDTKSRDLCEYYRNTINEDFNSIKGINLSNLDINEKKLFFIRFLYNTSFLDSLSLLDNEKETNKKVFLKLKNQLGNIESNEKIIREMYNSEFKEYFSDIDWLKKTS